jgi:DNA-binding response OmpR family regulator
VYGIVKQHNGYLNVYSEPGKGTTFKVYLPLLGAEQPEKEPPPLSSRKKGTETILVAEDDPAIRGLTKEILEDSGYTVIEAVDGMDAIDKFNENRARIDLLLVDMIMPKKNGKEVHDEIRKGGSAVKVIFLSGYPEDFVKTSGGLEKELDLLLKPITPQKLLLKIREVLDPTGPARF